MIKSSHPPRPRKRAELHELIHYERKVLKNAFSQSPKLIEILRPSEVNTGLSGTRLLIPPKKDPATRSLRKHLPKCPQTTESYPRRNAKSGLLRRRTTFSTVLSVEKVAVKQLSSFEQILQSLGLRSKPVSSNWSPLRLGPEEVPLLHWASRRVFRSQFPTY